MVNNTHLIIQISVIDIISIAFVTKIYRNSILANKSISRWLLSSIYMFFIVDIVYFIVYSAPHQMKYVSIFDIVHFIYYFVTISFIISMLIKSGLRARQFIMVLTLIIIISFIIFIVFSIDTQYFKGHITISIVQSIIDLVLFSLAFLWLIYSRNAGSTYIASGYVLCTASEFMMTSCYMTKILNLLDWAQLSWILGLILIMTGLAIIVSKKNYNLKDWLETDATIKTRLTFLTFVVVVISLIMFFMVIKEFSLINNRFYIFFPTIIMDGTLIVALFSILIGRTIDKPLLQIQKDIELSLSNNKTAMDEEKVIFGDSTRYSEIQKIEMHMKSLISYVNKQSKNVAIGILAQRVAHNLKSPLLVLHDCKNKLKNFAQIDEKLIYDLGIAIDNIKYTLLNLLNTNTENKFQTHEDSHKPRYLLLKPLIDEVVNQKSIEWHNKCALVYTDNTSNDDNIWINTLHFNFTNVISNLLNNSFEAFKADAIGKIELCLYKTHDYTTLNIKDNGCGIEKSILNQVIDGYSTKSSGQGIGLSSSIKYFKEIGGELTIVSTEIGQGTSIDLKIPNISPPGWLPANIDLSNYIVILDDATSIHSYLQSVFSRTPNVKYFREITEFKEWAKEHTSILESVTYFIDNQLDDGLV